MIDSGLLAALAARQGGGGSDAVSFMQGVVLTWNSQTGANTINVRGGVITNMPMLWGSEAMSMRAGQSVLIVAQGDQAWVLGRIVVPGSPEFFTGAMPAISHPFYQVNTDSPLQTNTVGGFYSKTVAGMVITHKKIKFGGRAQVSTGGVGSCTGNYRVQWYTSQPPNTANPPSGTLMATSVTMTGSTGTDFRQDYEYTWPAGMRDQLVFISFEPQLVSSSGGGGHWCAAMPSYMYGSDF